MYDFLGAQQQAMGNLSNAIAGYRSRKDEEQAREQAIAMNAIKMQQQGQQQQRDWELSERKMTLDEQRFDDEQRMNALRQREMQGNVEKQNIGNEVERMKFFHGVAASMKDQGSLDAGRNIVAQIDPDLAAKMPEKWDDNAASTFKSYTTALSGALRDKYKQKEHWIEDQQTGEKRPYWAREGEQIDENSLPQGFRFSTAPSDDMKLEQMRQTGSTEREKLKSQLERDRQKLQIKTDLQKKQMDIDARRANEQEALKSKNFKNEMDMRKEFDSSVDVKTYYKIKPQFEKMERAMSEIEDQKLSGKPLSLGSVDNTLVMTFNKMLDPDSAVLPAEFVRLPDDMPYFESLKARIEKFKHGGTLTDSERDAIIRMARNFKDVSESRYNEQSERYRGMASEYGYNPDMVARQIASNSSAASTNAAPPDVMQSAHGAAVQGPTSYTANDFLKEIGM